MELELGLKITRTRDDLSSSANLRIAKDRAGPTFLSTETETMFFLTAYLKGYRKEMVEIDINKEGTRIAIIGNKPVQELKMMGYMMIKKEMEIRVFRKVFLIPNGVNLDRIKAKFNDEESVLRIFMPKMVKGFSGVDIEELKIEEELGRSRAEMVEMVTKEPESKTEKTDHKAKKEVDEGGPVEKAIVGETMKEEIKGHEIQNMEEARLLVEGLVDEEKPQATIVAAEVSLERDDIIRKPMQEQQEVENMEGKDQVVEEKIERGRSKTNQIVADKVPEREDIGEKIQKESKNDQVETSQETLEIEHQRIEPKQPTAETPLRQKLTDLKGLTKKQTISEAEKVMQEDGIEEVISSPETTESTKASADQGTQQSELANKTSTTQNQVQGKHIKDEILRGEIPQEPQKLENIKDIQETTKIKPDQEEILSPVRPEGHGIEEIHGVENEIQEATDQVKHPEENVFDEHEPAGLEKQKDVTEEETQRKKSDSKKCKMCTPLVVAGSVFLVSLIAIFMRFIRAKKR